MIPTPAKSPGWHNASAISHLDEIQSGAKSSGWLKDQYRKLSGRHPAMSVSHPDEILGIAKSSGWLRDQISYLIRMTELNLNLKSSGWVSSWPYLTQLTYGQCRKSSGWLTMLPYVILMTYNSAIWTQSHPDELAPGCISSGWFMANAECHLDYLQCCPMSTGWHKVIWTISQPDELAPGRISSG